MRSLALALAMAVSTAGCAAIGAKAPDPDRPRNLAPDCNSGKGGVVLDGLTATGLGVTGLAIAGESSGGAILLGAVGAVYVFSAMSGSGSANRCREAHLEHAAYVEEQGGAERLRYGGLPTAPGAMVNIDEEEPPAPAVVGSTTGATGTPGTTMAVVAPRPAAPPPKPVVAPRPTPKPTPTPRPSAETDSDSDSDTESDTDTEAEDGDNPWSAFWKEVPR